MPTTPRVGVQVIVTKSRDPRLVLLGRRRGGYGDGFWALPGGHLEFGESFEDAARRELKEETGLVAYSLSYWGSLNTVDSDAVTHYVQIAVQVSAYKGQPSVCEPQRCYAVEWFDLDGLPDQIFEPSAPFLKRLRDATSNLGRLEEPDELMLALYRVDESRGMRRYCSYHLRASPPLIQIRFGRYLENGDRQIRTHSPENMSDALDILRKDIARRVSHKYRFLDAHGTLGVDTFKSLFPHGWADVTASEKPDPGLMDTFDQRLRRYVWEGSQLSLFHVSDPTGSVKDDEE